MQFLALLTMAASGLAVTFAASLAILNPPPLPRNCGAGFTVSCAELIQTWEGQ